MMEKRILIFVLSLHFAWLILAFPFKSPPPTKKPTKVVVSTKIIAPKKKEVIQTSLPKAAPSSKPKAKPQKKTATKPLTKAAPKPSKATELLKELESNMTNIESKLKNVRETKPLTIDSIQIEQWEETSNPVNNQDSYFEMITAIFRQSLTLPEFGAVKVTITVQPNGEIVNIQSVLTKSEVNFRYLEKTLPHLKLPAPPGASDLSITITFCEQQRIP